MGNGRIASVALALLAGGAALADDPMDAAVLSVDKDIARFLKAQDENDRIFEARIRRTGRLTFLDMEYSVRKAEFMGAGWEVPEVPVCFGEKPAPSGPMMYAKWTGPEEGGRRPQVLIVVFKHAFQGKAGSGEKAPPEFDPMTLVQGHYKEYVATLAEAPLPPPGDDAGKAPPGDKPAGPGEGAGPGAAPAAAPPKPPADVAAWVEPKRKTVGPAKVFAAAQGTAKQGGRRDRREWYSWNDKNATYVVVARIDGELIVPNGPGMGKGAHFTQAIRKYE